ncbi:uncharacterized protein LOC121251127 isoform X3 [Juglans microcarpa x Juglans regia]|uniref:uncharacterized protein LOC121251127 isoform X3 n=1 Tax=Juglans microcarpa x Juglans regia TaxID=2249226 RepID=UPI001B7EC0D5|nr:uncharacterized protein LOC121251127 isoform X3 [Juglans microcarpa x Juglans regia]
MDQTPLLAEATRNGLELVRSFSDKHLDLLRSSTRYISVLKGQVSNAVGREKGKYTLIRDLEESQLGIYDKPLPCFGCGIGWFSRDPRERAGLAASAIAALACTVVLLVIAAILFF